jgi:hypothetical protein
MTFITNNGAVIKNILKTVRLTLEPDFKQFWLSEIKNMATKNQSGGRLLLFSSVKNEFGFEEYLETTKNTKHRRISTQLRNGAHNLYRVRQA